MAVFAIVMYFGVYFYFANQLFQEFAFIQQLTIRTITDLQYIIIQFFIILFAFGCILYIALQREQRYQDDDQNIMKSIFFFDFDAIWSQYMLAIGEIGDLPDAFDAFDNDKFDRQEAGWKFFLYILFFMTTFITQIVYLNMIIAYMSDTFD